MAAVRPVAAVEPAVHAQLVGRPEQLAALQTVELALRRVRAHVLQQLGPRRVHLTAQLAGVRLGVPVAKNGQPRSVE